MAPIIQTIRKNDEHDIYSVYLWLNGELCYIGTATDYAKAYNLVKRHINVPTA